MSGYATSFQLANLWASLRRQFSHAFPRKSNVAAVWIVLGSQHGLFENAPHRPRWYFHTWNTHGFGLHCVRFRDACR
jgi:hypothetical protein